MKVIDLLNDIANYKEVPYKVVKIENKEMEKAILNVHKYLNEEIEIIEEDKKIEKLEIISSDSGTMYECIANKINEIIDYINKENK